MKKMWVGILITCIVIGLALLLYRIAGQVYLERVKSNVKLYIRDETVALNLYDPDEPSSKSKNLGSYLMHYFSISEDEIDHYLDYECELYRWFRLPITVVNDSDVSLVNPRLCSPGNTSYWLEYCAFSEKEWGYEIYPHTKQDVRAGAIFRVTEETMNATELESEEFSAVFSFEVPYGIFTLKGSVPSIFPYPGD